MLGSFVQHFNNLWLCNCKHHLSWRHHSWCLVNVPPAAKLKMCSCFERTCCWNKLLVLPINLHRRPSSGLFSDGFGWWARKTFQFWNSALVRKSSFVTPTPDARNESAYNPILSKPRRHNVLQYIRATKQTIIALVPKLISQWTRQRCTFLLEAQVWAFLR